jgi:hypothetical protein
MLHSLPLMGGTFAESMERRDPGARSIRFHSFRAGWRWRHRYLSDVRLPVVEGSHASTAVE